MPEMPGAGRPFELPYDGVWPAYAAPPAAAGPGAAVLGRVSAGRGLRLGARATIRADGHYVRIGDDFRLGARGTVHIAHAVHPTRIGDGVTAEDDVVIHACDVGEGCHLGAGAIVLDGARVGAGAALAAGAVVFPRSELAGGWLHAGLPARPVRPLAPGELAARHAAARAGGEGPAPAPEGRGLLFVARTASLRGGILAEGGNGVWFGCVLDANDRAIRLGAETNVQDNSRITAAAAEVRIGARSTIGHNVVLVDCTVGEASLVGIGAVVAPGTAIEPDVLLAAGAATEPGQVLERGWLWGGRPARPIRRLDDARRAIIAGTWPRYVAYARAFAAAQAAVAAA